MPSLVFLLLTYMYMYCKKHKSEFDLCITLVDAQKYFLRALLNVLHSHIGGRLSPMSFSMTQQHDKLEKSTYSSRDVQNYKHDKTAYVLCCS